MKILYDFPPNYEDICKVFDIRNHKELLFSYGDIIYYPNGKKKVGEDLKIHEKTHQKQQGNDPRGWWDKYLSDPKFRLSQEIAAYRNQFHYFITKNHDLKIRNYYLRQIAMVLSGKVYGNIVDFWTAWTIISLKEQ